jgi:hypothetical protein
MELAEGGELFDRIVEKGHYSEKLAANTFRTIMQVRAQTNTIRVWQEKIVIFNENPNPYGTIRICPSFFVVSSSSSTVDVCGGPCR